VEFELVVPLLLGIAVLVFIAAAYSIDNWFAIRRLRKRIDLLERGEVPTGVASPPSATPLQPSPPIAAPTAAANKPPRRPLDASRLEDLVGGVWLQNVGSILLLLGTFFLILWGYTKGKIGPEVLIGAGVALGLVLAWRGDRLAQTVRPLGYALLGVGLGVVYITIYLGHFRMHVFSDWVTFALLALLSIISVDVGLRRREAVIATLGVFGAVLPLMLGSMSGAGFHLEHGERLVYLALVNAAVFALAMARGWSGLVLAAVLGTTMAWMADGASSSAWGPPTQIGLSAMYTALCVALVARLARKSDPASNLDIAAVTAPPVLLLIVSTPFFETSRTSVTGSLLAVLSLLQFAVAIWVDRRRASRDLWRPLIAAGTLFLTAALERFLDPAHLTLAWTAEGALLVWIGLAPRGGWFRVLGYAVTSLALLRLLYFPQSYAPGAAWALGFMNPSALRDLVAIGILYALSERLRRRDASLTKGERFLPNLWLATVHLSIMAWIFREAPHAARALRSSAATASIVAFAWALQGAALLHQSLNRRAVADRVIAYVVAAAAFLAFLWGAAEAVPWVPGDRPVLYPTGIFLLVAASAFVAMSLILRWRRDRLSQVERQIPNAAALIASTTFLIWTAREAGRAANTLMPGNSLDSSRAASTAMLAAVITSAGWILHAALLLVIGWTRRSAFFRWSGLGLVGLTTLKFILLDLQRVDVFWRFVTALGVGAVMLLVSFAYQRRRPAAGGPIA
jgi:uncharacterized membrane protein